MKRILSLILVFLLLANSIVFVESMEFDVTRYIVEKEMKGETIKLSEKDPNKEIYGLSNARYTTTLSDFVLNYDFGLYDLTEEYRDEFKKIFYLCKEIKEVTLSDGYLYVRYDSTDEKEVTIIFFDDYIFSKNIYDPKSDTLYVSTNDEVYLIKNAKSSVSMLEISSDGIEAIYDLYSNYGIDFFGR